MNNALWPVACLCAACLPFHSLYYTFLLFLLLADLCAGSDWTGIWFVVQFDCATAGTCLRLRGCHNGRACLPDHQVSYTTRVRNCLAWLPLCCCWHGRGPNRGCCSWGNCSFQMVCGLFCHRFAAALLFSHSLILSNAWLRALLWNMRTEREKERERGERKQQTASCCPISIHLHSRLFFELAQTNLKRFMVIVISPDNELS